MRLIDYKDVPLFVHLVRREAYIYTGRYQVIPFEIIEEVIDGKYVWLRAEKDGWGKYTISRTGDSVTKWTQDKIREQVESGGVSAKEIAAQYCLSLDVVYDIIGNLETEIQMLGEVNLLIDEIYALEIKKGKLEEKCKNLRILES